MGQLFKILTASVWALLCLALAVQSANAQKRYPAHEEAWDATDYRALVQRVENDGLALPTLSGGERPVFERMIAADNIPLRMGLNTELAITVRYQKLRPILQPLHQLIDFYSDEAKKGKPYAAELARLMVYESQATGILLDIGDPYLETLKTDVRYKTHVALLEEMKSGARQLYADLVNHMAETNLYSSSDILVMVNGAMTILPSYQPIFSDKDRQALMNALEQNISATSDAKIKAAMTELSEAIKHGRIPA